MVWWYLLGGFTGGAALQTAINYYNDKESRAGYVHGHHYFHYNINDWNKWIRIST